MPPDARTRVDTVTITDLAFIVPFDVTTATPPPPHLISLTVVFSVTGKVALLHAVMQAMMEQCKVPDPSRNRQRDIRDLCHAVHRLARKHPGAFRIYETYEHWLPAEHRLHEAFHATLVSAGFSPMATVRAVRVLLAYTEAFAVDEIPGWLDPADRAELPQSLTQGPYPVLTSLLDEIGTTDADADFEFGLNVLIRGLEGERGDALDL